MTPQAPVQMLEISETVYDVVIAGAGPVGLFLAHELRLAKLSVLVLEKLDDPSSPLKRLPFGMRGLTVPTTEALYRRGLLDDITNDNPASIKSIGLQSGRQAGHFAGIQFNYKDIDTSRWESRLPSPAETKMLAVQMENVEVALAKRAVAIGVEIRRGLGVEGLDQSGDRVTIKAGSDTIHARWLVGCDGGRSTVRKLGGFEFVGTDPEFTGYSALVDLADRDGLLPGKHNTPAGMYSLTPSGQLVMADFDGAAFHRETITLEHLQGVLRRISGTNATLAAIHVATTWTDRAAQVTTYRKGRVLLAGDAAHIHSPLGGQGLNLGIGDALNLGWKLAATVQGWAPDGLLDTYSTERLPIGKLVLDWSRAQVTVMGPSQASRALEAVMRDVIATRDGATYFAERVLGLSLRYDFGEKNQRLVGRSTPNFELIDNGVTIGVLLREGKGVLLDFGSHATLQEVGKQWSGRMDYIAANAKETLGLSVVLVRPDGFVAWASEGEPDIDEVVGAASRWFGVGNRF